MTPRLQEYKVEPVKGLFVLYQRPLGCRALWEPVDSVEADSAEQARDRFVGRAVSGIAAAELC